MIKCIGFDLDGTLYDENAYVESCYRAIANYISPDHEESITQFMLQTRAAEGDSEVFQHVIEKYSLPESDLAAFIQIYHTFPAKICLYPDARSFLETNISVEMAILTNGGVKTQQNKCKILGLETYFKRILITGTLPRKHWKPAAEAFHWLCDETNVQPNECLYIGDSLTNDYYGAIKAGMNACLIDRKKQLNDPGIACIHTLTQINDILKRL